MVRSANSLVFAVLAWAVAFMPGGVCFCGHDKAESQAAASAELQHICCAATASDATEEPSAPDTPDCPHCNRTMLLADDCGVTAPAVASARDFSAWPSLMQAEPSSFAWMPKPEALRFLDSPYAPPPTRSGSTLRALRCLFLT